MKKFFVIAAVLVGCVSARGDGTVVPSTPFTRTLLRAPDAATARTTLGVTGSTLGAGSVDTTNLAANVTNTINALAANTTGGISNGIVQAFSGPTVVFPGAYKASESPFFGFGISDDGAQSVYEPYGSTAIGEADNILAAAGQAPTANWSQDYCAWYDLSRDRWLMTFTANFGGASASTNGWTNSLPLLVSTNGFDWSFLCAIQTGTNNGNAHAWVSDFSRTADTKPVLFLQNTNQGIMVATWPLNADKTQWLFPPVPIQGDYTNNFGYDCHFCPLPGYSYGMIYKGLSGTNQHQWRFSQASSLTNYYTDIAGWKFPFGNLTNLNPAMVTDPEGPSIIPLNNGYWRLIGLYNTGGNVGWFFADTLDGTNWTAAQNMRFSRGGGLNHFSPYIPSAQEYAKWLWSFSAFQGQNYFGPLARFLYRGQLLNTAFPYGGEFRFGPPGGSTFTVYNMAMGYRVGNGITIAGYDYPANSFYGANSKVGFRMDDNGSVGMTIQVGNVPTNAPSDTGHRLTTLGIFPNAAETNGLTVFDATGTFPVFTVTTNGTVLWIGGDNAGGDNRAAWDTTALGQVIRLGAGTFNLNSTLIASNNLAIEGEGQGQTVIQFNGTGPAFDGVTKLVTINIRNLTIRGTNTVLATNVTTWINAQSALSMSRGSADHVTFSLIGSNCVYVNGPGGFSGQSNNVAITDCIATNSYMPIYGESNCLSEWSYVRDFNAYQCFALGEFRGANFEYHGGMGHIARHGLIYSGTEDDADTSTNRLHCTIEGIKDAHISGNPAACLEITNGFTGPQILNCYFGGVSCPFDIILDTCTNVQLHNCQFGATSSGNPDIMLRNWGKCMITENYTSQTSQGTITSSGGPAVATTIYNNKQSDGVTELWTTSGNWAINQPIIIYGTSGQFSEVLAGGLKATNGLVVIGTNTFQGDTNAPANTTNPRGWLPITNGTVQFRIPIYQ